MASPLWAAATAALTEANCLPGPTVREAARAGRERLDVSSRGAAGASARVAERIGLSVILVLSGSSGTRSGPGSHARRGTRTAGAHLWWRIGGLVIQLKVE